MRKKYKIVGDLPIANGQSQVSIECPFCEKIFNAYVWSMAGRGKKCPNCSAIHHYRSGEADNGHN